MAIHYTQNTLSDTVFCNKCNAFTVHNVMNGRLGYCIPCYEKRQLTAAEERAREAAAPKQEGFNFAA